MRPLTVPSDLLSIEAQDDSVNESRNKSTQIFLLSADDHVMLRRGRKKGASSVCLGRKKR